jgi:hypothetical protein
MLAIDTRPATKQNYKPKIKKIRYIYHTKLYSEPFLAVLANLFIHTKYFNTLFPEFHMEKREIQQHFSSLLQLYMYIRVCFGGGGG